MAQLRALARSEGQFAIIESIMGVISSLKTKSRAHLAALRHGRPATKLEVILVSGADGSHGTVAYLAAMLRAAGSKVGVITQQYVQVGDDRAPGSDQADVLGDEFRLQSLLAQMRRSGCQYALIEVPAELPAHQFTAIKPAMIVVRRCGDVHLGAGSVAPRVAMLQRLLALQPAAVVLNWDDPCRSDFRPLPDARITYGAHPKADCRLIDVRLHPLGSAVRLVIDHQTELNLVTTQVGKQNAYSMVGAASAAYLLHVPIEAIEQGAHAAEQLPGQLEYIPVQRPFKLAIDTAATPEGVAESLETLKHFAKNRLLVLLSSSLGVAPGWRPLLGELVGQQADRVVVCDGEYTGAESAAQVRQQLLQGLLTSGSEAKTEEIADRQAAIEKLLSIARRGDTIAILTSTTRPYRQLGSDRPHWSDRGVVEELLG